MKDALLAAIIPDCHIPYEHKRAYKLMLEVLSYHKPDGIYLTGDFADFYDINQHGAKDPRIIKTLQDEVAAVNRALDEMDKLFPAAKKVFCQGNHEFRFERFIQNKAPELFGFVDCETLFNFKDRPGWAWIPYKPDQRARVLNSRLLIRHEPIGSTASSTLNRALSSVVFGHVHRIMEARQVGLDGTEHVCFSPGWLGDKRKDAVFGYVRGHYQWHLGFALVWIDPKSGAFTHEIVRIQDNMSCIVGGKRFRA